MVDRAVCLSVLLSALVAAASGGCAERDDNTARVTIDMRCASDADCPTGFACEADAEHGPPITMCESADTDVGCPAGYETRIGYAQTFCKPRGSVGSHSRRGSGPAAITVRDRRAARTGHGGL
jgi:hypothetical protein